MRKAHMAHILRLLYCRHRIQYLLVHKTSSFGVCINREVTHAERGEVLEEMGALARVDVVVLQSYFHDDSGSTDMRPLDRHTQIMVARTPTARTYQHIILPFGKELAVDTFDIISHIEIIHRREVIIILHINHIYHIFTDSMPERIVGTEQTVGIRYRLHILIEHLLGIHYRTNLKQIELAGSIVVDIAGKLYFHRTAHRLGAKLHRHLHQLWQRHYSMLEHTGKGNQFSARFIHAIIDNLVVWVEGRGDIGEALVFNGILDPKLEDVEAIIYLEILTHMLHVEGIKLGLRIAQSQLRF